MLDGSWGLLKKYLPRQLVTKKEHVVNVQKFQNCIWSWAWRHNKKDQSLSFVGDGAANTSEHTNSHEPQPKKQLKTKDWCCGNISQLKLV